VTALFVTGATGFIGRRVLAALRSTPSVEVCCLTRRASSLTSLPVWNGNWRAVTGDLTDPTTYAAEITPGATVVHLAGAVGKRRASAFARDNVAATRTLAATARDRGAAHFVHISSIAAVYPDVAAYTYARSKRDGESIVAASGMPFTILRPTIVLGPGSTLLASLSRLATLPLPIILGRGDIDVQPVHVDDVARVIVCAALDRWGNETIDVGGPEVVTFDALIAAIRAARGRPARSAVHLPLTPVRALLSVVEPLLLELMPLSASQLAAFEFSSRAAPSARLVPLLRQFRPLREMVAA
jgi:nucleoside-diphosphate-sugar epimerase